MALILDKSITGITYDDGSGHTETGYTNLSYTTDCGCVLTDPYLVIDSILLNKFYECYVHKFPITIGTYVYRDENARKVEMRCPHEETTFYVEIGSDVYNQYFSITDGLSEYGVYTQAYKYINSLLPNWKSDEINK